ncbi:hypothetical protein Tco_1484437 [Tanacetum coccineum]
MSTANQQTLVESGALDRPPILEKRSYVTRASHFLRFLDNKRDEGELMKHSIDKRPYKRKEILDPNDDTKTIIEPLSKMSQQNKNQYYADIKVINYILQGIPNDIYSYVDASEDGESLTSVYERFSTLINVMDKNKVNPIDLSINTKFLNSLQPEWTFKAKKAAMNHDQLVLVANSHASLSYSCSPQPYYVTHPSSVIDNTDDYQGEIQGDAQEDKLSTAMLLLARAITPQYVTLTNNRLLTSSNTRNQAVIKDGHVDIQSKNAGYAGNGNRYARRTNGNQATNAEMGKGHYARECPKPRVRKAKYFREQMLLTTKDEVGVHLDEEENDFMLDNAYKDNTLEELNATVIMMARIQPTNDNSDAEPTYDAEFISEVNDSQIDIINGLLSKSDHEQRHHEKLETIIHTLADDQIDSDIICDDPYVDNNSGQAKHDTNSHDQSLHDFDSLINNVQFEAENLRLHLSQLLEDIVSLEEKLRSHDRILYKMSHSHQIIHMLSKKPNKVYDPHLKTGVGYKNPKRLKKANEAQPKMYNGEKLESNNLKVDLPNYEGTLEDVEKVD